MSTVFEEAERYAMPHAGSVERRGAEDVMRLDRLGSFHQFRLSFMRILTRRLHDEKWTLTRTSFAIDSAGVGHAVYTIRGPERAYSLVAFSHDLPDDQRTDRVIATAWDATFALFDGVPGASDIERLAQQVPLQETGRLTQSELTLSRANRSVRLWEHVVSRLAAGEQPERERMASVGYLMRTTAVYGSGKFGAADLHTIQNRAEFAAPFQAEMLTVYLIRQFVRELVQHMADAVAPERAARLDPDMARSLGIGNSTGLGMAPFLINHPQLFNNWISVREEALARVRTLVRASEQEVWTFLDLLGRVRTSFTHWHTSHPGQQARIKQLIQDMTALQQHALAADLQNDHPWDRLYRWAACTLGTEAQECLVSLMMEPYPQLVDGMACCLSAAPEHEFQIDGSMSPQALLQLIEDHYRWALAIDWDCRESCARAWYVSAEKLEPRLGERHEESLESYEQPLAPARDMARLHQALQQTGTDSTAAFLLQHPEHRHAVRRLQLLLKAPYAEIRDNTIAHSLVPFDMLRCKLAFFGATHFDPRSDRWLRICLYANAPYAEDLQGADADTWVYPPAVH